MNDIFCEYTYLLFLTFILYFLFDVHYLIKRLSQVVIGDGNGLKLISKHYLDIVQFFAVFELIFELRVTTFESAEEVGQLEFVAWKVD